MYNTKLNLFVIFLTMVSLMCASQQIPSNKVVEIQPIALQVIVPHYSRVVTLFVDDQNWDQYVPLFQNKAHQLMNQPNYSNSTLFAICNLTKDVSRKLQKYGRNISIKYITSVKYYTLQIPPKDQLSRFFDSDFPNFYDKLCRPIPKHYKPQQINEHIQQEYAIVVYPYNKTQSQLTRVIYGDVYDYLSLLEVNLYVAFDEDANEVQKSPQIYVFKNGQKYSQYPQSAIKALYNFTRSPSSIEVNDLLDFINIQTIDLVSKLNDDNYYRVFGSQLDSQLLLIYREKDLQNGNLERARQMFRRAAEHNKQNQLKSHRVLFAEATVQFLNQYFADEILTDPDTMFKIIHTKTSYSTFQLRKYEYKQHSIDVQKLTNFIQEVRLKKVKPTYKSEPIPPKQQNSQKKIKKIVGQTFIQQIFEQKSKSVIVLFIDSKDEKINQPIFEQLQSFTQKYEEAYKDHVIFTYFDLAKNEHQLLTIKNAPEMVVFQRTNKKQPKFFRGQFTHQIIKNWMNFEIKDLTIPQNFGEPLLPLGGATQQPQQAVRQPQNTDL